jgi:hypothetical protein
MQWHTFGLIASFGAAFILDRFWPKWASDLMWSDIHMGIYNLAAFGIEGSRLHLRFGSRRLFVCKDHKSGKLRLAVAVIADEWDDVFGTQRESKAFAKEQNAVCYHDRASRHYCCIFKPKDDPIGGSLRLVHSLALNSGESLTPLTLACIDSSKRFAWRKYPDIEYPDIKETGLPTTAWTATNGPADGVSI